MANSFTFAGYDFSGLNVIIQQGDLPYGAPLEMDAVRLSRGDGAVASPSVYGPRQFPLVLHLEVASGGLTALLAALDTLMLKLNRTEDAQLIFDLLDDRYWNARVIGKPKLRNLGQSGAEIGIVFQANNPAAFAVSESNSVDAVSADYSAPDTIEYVVAGSAAAYPTILFAPSVTTGRIIVANETLEETLVWEASGSDLVSGDFLKLECDPFTQLASVMRIGEDSYTAEMTLVEGRFPSFTPGQTNVLAFWGITGTATVTWRNRYL